MKRRRYHLQKDVQCMNIKKNGLLFHYNIRADPMLGIGYAAVIRIQCSYFSCVSNLDSTWNRRQYVKTNSMFIGFSYVITTIERILIVLLV